MFTRFKIFNVLIVKGLQLNCRYFALLDESN